MMKKVLGVVVAAVLCFGAHAQEKKFIDGKTFEENVQQLWHKLKFIQRRDGQFDDLQLGGFNCVTTKKTVGKKANTRYLYANVTNKEYKSAGYDEVELSIVYQQKGNGVFFIQYDSYDDQVDKPAFKTIGTFRVKNGGRLAVSTIKLTDGFFDGRTNGSDLRICRTNAGVVGDLVVEGVYLKKIR